MGQGARRYLPTAACTSQDIQYGCRPKVCYSSGCYHSGMSETRVPLPGATRGTSRSGIPLTQPHFITPYTASPFIPSLSFSCSPYETTCTCKLADAFVIPPDHACLRSPSFPGYGDPPSAPFPSLFKRSILCFRFSRRRTTCTPFPLPAIAV